MKNLKVVFAVLKEVYFWAIFPALLLGVAYLHLGIVSEIICLVFAYLLHALLQNNIPYSGFHSRLKDKHIARNMLIVSFFAGVVLLVISSLNPQSNPWGEIGWCIVIGLNALIVVLAFVTNEYWFDLDEWNTPLFLIYLVSIGAFVYVHWASQFVWVPLFFVLLFFGATGFPRFEFDDKKKNQTFLSLLIILVAIGLISTAWQFWFCPMFWGLKLWSLLCWIIGTLVVLIGSFLIIQYRRKTKANRLKEEKEEQEREARRELIRKATEVYTRRNEEFEKNAEGVSWKAIFNLRDAVYKDIEGKNNIVNIVNKPEILCKISLKDMLTVSDEKKIIVWDGRLVSFALENFSQALKACYDDETIIEFTKRLEELKNLPHDYNGYDALVEKVIFHEPIKNHLEMKKIFLKED